eukprot:517375_1
MWECWQPGQRQENPREDLIQPRMQSEWNRAEQLEQDQVELSRSIREIQIMHSYFPRISLRVIICDKLRDSTSTSSSELSNKGSLAYDLNSTSACAFRILPDDN